MHFIFCMKNFWTGLYNQPVVDVINKIIREKQANSISTFFPTLYPIEIQPPDKSLGYL